MEKFVITEEERVEILKLYGMVINEATSSGGRGSFSIPLSPGVRLFNKSQLQPFCVPTSEYNDAELAYDSYDGKMGKSKKEISKIEKKARKISKYIKNHPILNDDDGDILNKNVGNK